MSGFGLAIWLKKIFAGMKNLFIVGVVSRVVVFFSAIVGFAVIGVRETGPNEPLWDPPCLPMVNLFCRWDAGWYLQIALHGYPAGNNPLSANWAWFPLYPVAMRIVGQPLTIFFLREGQPITIMGYQAFLLAGFLISNFLFFVNLLIFYRLSQNVLANHELAFLSTIFFAFWPGSLFYSCVYSESLFMTLVLGSFYFLETEKIRSATLSGFLAGLTRPNGFLVFVPLFCRGIERRRYALILGSLLICASYLFFSIFGFIMTGVFPVREIVVNQVYGKLPFLFEQLIQSLKLDIGYGMIGLFDAFFTFLPFSYLLSSKPLVSAQTLGLRNSQSEDKYFTFALAQLFMILFYSNVYIYSLHRYLVPLIPLYWVLARFWSRSEAIGMSLLALLIMMLSIGAILFATWRPYI